MKLLTAISFVLIVLGATAANPTLGTTNNQGQITPGNIKNTVTIQVNQEANLPKLHFILFITDENNRHIGGAQLVEPGTWKYQFSEQGPVTGIRIAHLVQSTSDDTLMPFSCNPDVKSGTFRNGVVYNFNLYPTRALPE